MPPTIAPLAKYKLVFLGDQVAHAGKQCNPCTPDFLSHHFALTLPGTQSVGKTSIITRFMYDQFDKAYQVQVPQFMVVSAFQNCCVSPHDMASLRPGLDPPGNNRNRLPLKDNVPRGPHCAPAAVGHSRPGAIPFADPQLYPGLIGSRRCVRHHGPGVVLKLLQGLFSLCLGVAVPWLIYQLSCTCFARAVDRRSALGTRQRCCYHAGREQNRSLGPKTGVVRGRRNQSIRGGRYVHRDEREGEL